MPIRLVEKALIAVIVFLVFVITVTTVWVFRERDEEAAAGVAVLGGDAAEQSFTAIGRQRAVLREVPGEDRPPTVIVRVVFPYNAADTVFTEELARNIGFFRETLAAYFAAMTMADPKLHDETAMKTELLDLFNARLRLGKIDRLFFSEFLIID
jgi:flagellar basal body-associated protein FliL